MEELILKKAKSWLSPPFDSDTAKEVKQLIRENPDELIDSFYKDLEFGTGGMRGIMGVGTNRLNRYTIGKVTQGLSNYLNQQFPKEQIRIAIAYDCRHNSREFSQIVANIFSANNIRVFLFDDLRPTPELSFAVRHLNCHSGVVLTASHNPPEYNGYKVYWNDGAQIVPPYDENIIQEVNRVDIDHILFDPNPQLIEAIGKIIDDQFIDACVRHGSFTQLGKHDFKIVFTSLHGASIKSIPDALQKAGFSQVHVVQEQSIPDGDFPTVQSPNPEEPQALKIAMDMANEVNADMVIGTDPDADRLGIAVRNLAGKLELLTGNQTNAVLIDYLLKKKKENKELNGKQMIGTTIVSSDIMFELADLYNVECRSVLTGFKWIGKMIRDFEGKKEFVGGGEESFGFMVGDFVRDKDSVTSTLLAAEIGALAKHEGSSFFERLLEVYQKTNCYQERLISVVKKGKSGSEEITSLMKNFREHPFSELDDSKVIRIDDYKTSTSIDVLTHSKIQIELPESNVLIFHTEDESKIAIRPSGTEPKIKFYISVKGKLPSANQYGETRKKLDMKIERIIGELRINYRIKI